MAMALQVYTFLQQYLNSHLHPSPPKSLHPLRIGIISTAMINPAAIIHPVETHSEAVITAVASRDLEAAQKYAKKYGFDKAYGSYQDLLDDPDIDAVYISLPNGMHCEWATRAIKAGKHVLLEKPFTSNAEEARALVKLAEDKGKVLLEAFHYRFHPAIQYLHDFLRSPEAGGKIIRTSSSMTTPTGSIPRGKNIRWSYDLAGGSFMDMDYVLSATRYLTGASREEEILTADATKYPDDERVDSAMRTEMLFKGPQGEEVRSKMYTDFEREWWGGVVPRLWDMPKMRVETEGKVVELWNFMMPHLGHWIEVTDKRTGERKVVKRYAPEEKGRKGEEWWSTYRYMLEAWVDKIKGRKPEHWISGEDSIRTMEGIDAVYEKSGLGARQGTYQCVTAAA